jgi:hypothetical protein
MWIRLWLFEKNRRPFSESSIGNAGRAGGGAKPRYPRYNVGMGTHPEHNWLIDSREADLDA